MTETVSFEDLIIQKIDNRGKTPPVIEQGYPLIEVNAITKNSIYPNPVKATKYVNQATWDNWFRQHLQEDDILFTTVGTIAESAIVPRNPGYAIAQNILGFRFNKKIIDPLYALYMMRSTWFIDQISGRTIETVQKSIKWADMRGIKITLPDIQQQHKVVNIVKSLDEKIELNRRMNETLEKMGQALFKHYFVDDTDSKTWPIVRLEESFDVVMGQSPPGSSYNEIGEGTVFYQGRAEFSVRYPKNRLFTTEPKRMAKKGDILLSVRAPVGDINQATETCCVGRGVAAISSKDGLESFTYYQTKNLQKRFSDFNAEGTVFGAINGNQLKGLKIYQPPLEFREEFNNLVKPLDVQILNNSVQTEELTKLRDLLLPRLISGKINVN